MRSMWQLCASLVALVSLAQAQDPAQSTIKKYPKSILLSYEDLASSGMSRSPLARIEYDPRSLDYTLTSWTPPSVDSLQSTSQEPQSTPLIRVLLPEGGATVTSLGAFDPKLSQDIDLWISKDNGQVISASIRAITPPPLSKEEELQRQKEERLRKRGKAVSSTIPKPKSKKAKDAVVGEVTVGPVVKVNLLIAGQGPAPKLNSRKPAQVDAQGNEVVQEEQQEKTFLQKYWYLLLGLAFVLMSSAGGKE
ncbi:hypothetical protein LTR51_007718 [Lithohypha guttulata]|nr:hypothetical protein LTR51_007718 [Lithohypha guttulata]